LNTPGIDGMVLALWPAYGPGTWFDKPGSAGALTTDAAAHAALLAVHQGRARRLHIAEDRRRVLGRQGPDGARHLIPSFRMALN
jgi:hypothetical protein